MEIQREWLGPCGLYCGVCGILIADRDGNDKFKAKLAGVYGLTPEQIRCEGCLAEPDKVFVYCRVCPIKQCTQERGYEGCHACDEFPCEHVDNFPMEVGKRVILRAIPQWREWGTERWVAEEERRYHCPHCGHPQFRGAKRCRSCREPLDLDG